MTIPANNVLLSASKIVQDTTNVRWPIEELLQWLNDGQREIVLHRPDANPKTAVMTLAAGTRQTLKDKVAEGVAGGVGSSISPAKLLDVIAVATGTSATTINRTAAVRKIEREVLDAQNPSWHSATGVTAVKHFMVDPRDPLSFYVYPPAAATGASLEVLFSAYPTDIGITAGAVTGNISLADIYGNALLDYVLYRAYSKDSDYAGNANRAQAHYTAFANSLGIELKGTLMMGAQNTWNPNTPNRAAQAPQG